jgi:hypothetical protein
MCVAILWTKFAALESREGAQRFGGGVVFSGCFFKYNERTWTLRERKRESFIGNFP